MSGIWAIVAINLCGSGLTSLPKVSFLGNAAQRIATRGATAICEAVFPLATLSQLNRNATHVFQRCGKHIRSWCL